MRIFRFAMVGTLNALITALVVWLLMHIEGESYITANIIAYVIAQIHNFIWCKYWIFPLESGDKKNSIWHQMLFFAGAFLLAYSAQFLFLLMLVELLHCNELHDQQARYVPLGHFNEVLFFDVVQSLFQNHLTCQIRIVGAEHQYSFARQQE